MHKNEIEKLFIDMTKWIRGKGPDNLNVKIAKDCIIISIFGITSNLEKETIKYFPEYEDYMLELRSRLLQKMFEEHKYKFETMVDKRIIGNDFKYNYKKDKAILSFKTKPHL